MFNEKNSIWIKVYKVFVQIMFWLLSAASVILFFVGIGDGFGITGNEFLDALIVFVIGAVATITYLIVNMLVLQFLNNIQVIREKIEKM